MHTLILGAKGQLGRELMERFARDGDVTGVDLPELDVADAGAVNALAREVRPTLIINAAAYTDVERAEDEPEQAFRANEAGARVAAEAAAACGAPVVYYSTDFVFDGDHNAPYEVTDAVNPLSVYGRSKLAGEAATRESTPRHFVLRTAWLYGPGGNNFVEKILRAAESRPRLTVVAHETGSPTYTFDLAEATARIVRSGGFGTYHVVNSGMCSRHELAREALTAAGIATPIEPCSPDAFPMKARRPVYSVLSIAAYEAATGQTMPHWKDALKRYIERRLSRS